MSSSSRSNTSGAVTAATAALAACTATAAAAWLYRKQTKSKSQNSQNGKNHDLPSQLTECPYVPQLQLAIELALKAGANMLPHIDNKGTIHESSEDSLGISTKSNDADFATLVDVENEHLITRGILGRFPNHEIIGEEAVGTGEIPQLTCKPTWICDPIDGTTNFANGFPLTCVSIGYCEEGEAVMGVAYAPATDELYVGVRGWGAYRNAVRIRSEPDNNAKSAKKTLSNAVVCYEFGYAREEASVDKIVNAVARILKHGCRSTRSTGSGVLDICYVAAGKLDVVYTGVAEEGWKPWDYCAAQVVAEEGGCTMRSLRGDGAEEEFDEMGHLVEGPKFDLYSKSMICGVNRTVVEQTRRVVLDLKSDVKVTSIASGHVNVLSSLN